MKKEKEPWRDEEDRSFASLAMGYFPKCNPKSAVRSLTRWIRGCKPLKEKLDNTGFGPYNHRYLTPIQRDLIVEYLGEP